MRGGEYLGLFLYIGEYDLYLEAYAGMVYVILIGGGRTFLLRDLGGGPFV